MIENNKDHATRILALARKRSKLLDKISTAKGERRRTKLEAELCEIENEYASVLREARETR